MATARNSTFRKRFGSLAAGLLLVGVTGLFGGCVLYDTGGYYDDGTGSYYDSGPLLSLLTVEWVVDGLTGSGVCRSAGVDAAEVAVYDRSDRLVFRDLEPCENGYLDLDVDPGWYSVDVTLIDGFGDPISETGGANTTVGRNEEVILTVDFDSFLFF